MPICNYPQNLPPPIIENNQLYSIHNFVYIEKFHWFEKNNQTSISKKHTFKAKFHVTENEFKHLNFFIDRVGCSWFKIPGVQPLREESLYCRFIPIHDSKIILEGNLLEVHKLLEFKPATFPFTIAPEYKGLTSAFQFGNHALGTYDFSGNSQFLRAVGQPPFSVLGVHINANHYLLSTIKANDTNLSFYIVMNGSEFYKHSCILSSKKHSLDTGFSLSLSYFEIRTFSSNGSCIELSFPIHWFPLRHFEAFALTLDSSFIAIYSLSRNIIKTKIIKYTNDNQFLKNSSGNKFSSSRQSRNQMIVIGGPNTASLDMSDPEHTQKNNIIISELQIYNRSLNEEEVLAIYKASKDFHLNINNISI